MFKCPFCNTDLNLYDKHVNYAMYVCANKPCCEKSSNKSTRFWYSIINNFLDFMGIELENNNKKYIIYISYGHNSLIINEIEKNNKEKRIYSTTANIYLENHKNLYGYLIKYLKSILKLVIFQ